MPKADHAGYLAGDFILIYPFLLKFLAGTNGHLLFPHRVITFVGFYLYLLAKEHFKITRAYVISFPDFSLNSNLISHSVEIRAYAVMPTLALMALYFALKVFKKTLT